MQNKDMDYAYYFISVMVELLSASQLLYQIVSTSEY